MEPESNTKPLQVLAEWKRRFVALPLEKQWFGNLIGFVMGFIFFASTLRFDPQHLVHIIVLLKLALVNASLLLLAAIAYKAWLGQRFNYHNLAIRIIGFFMYLAGWGLISAALLYDAMVLIFFKG